jgi:hypothetical protein
MRFIEAGTLSGNVTNALARVTGVMATRWIREVGRSFELSVLGDLYDTHLALPLGFGDPYIEHLGVVQNPDLGSEAEEEMEEVEAMEEEQEEEEEEEEEEEKEEEEESLDRSYGKYSPLSTRSGKVGK